MLDFWRGLASVVIVDDEEVLARWGFGVFAEVFEEFVDYVAGVFLHAECDLVWGGVVDVHA